MTTLTTANLIKYVDLQMAAEAFLSTDSSRLKDDIQSGLIAGNNRASTFTGTQADDFRAHWKVLDQKSDTSTGFSGTLFQNKGTGEPVISMRSTEFVDDAARDSEATNVLEVKDKGWAFGQIADMEQWYSGLKTNYASDFNAVGGSAT